MKTATKKYFSNWLAINRPQDHRIVVMSYGAQEGPN